MIEDAKAAAAVWLKAFKLPNPPAEGGKDLRGRVVRICSFPDQDKATVQFFFPKRSVPFQNEMVKTLRTSLRKRGAKFERIVITPEDYARWIQKTGAEDTEVLRYSFATLLPHVTEHTNT